MFERIRTVTTSEEDGHAIPALAAFVAGIGAVVLGIGSANNSGVTAVIGGIVLGVGLVGFSLLDHVIVAYDIFGRLENLEGTKKD